MSEDNGEQKVPLSRLQSVIDQKRELEARIKELSAEVDRLTPLAASVEEVTAALEAERTGRAEDAARFAARESFVRVGMDPETDADAMEVIRARYERLPKRDRPTLHEWLQGDAKEDRIAGALLPKAEDAEPAPASAGEQDAAAPAAAEPRVSTRNGTQPAPEAAGRMTKAQYEAALAKPGATKEDIRRAMELYFGG